MKNHREAAVDVLIESMKQRYPEMGFLLHPNIAFCNISAEEDDKTGMGIIATSDIAKDEILFVIPDSALFCVENVVTAQNKDLQRLVDKVKQ